MTDGHIAENARPATDIHTVLDGGDRAADRGLRFQKSCNGGCARRRRSIGRGALFRHGARYARGDPIGPCRAGGTHRSTRPTRRGTGSSAKTELAVAWAGCSSASCRSGEGRRPRSPAQTGSRHEFAGLRAKERPSQAPAGSGSGRPCSKEGASRDRADPVAREWSTRGWGHVFETLLP